MIVKLRTRYVWALMRYVPANRRGRVPRPRRGAIQVLGGLAVHQLLALAHFPLAGAQSYGMLSGEHEVPVQEALRRHLAPGGTFVDVGANIGVAALAGARLVGPRGRVIAIDAQRESVEATQAAAALNGHDHLTTIHAAVGARDATTELIVTADPLWTRVASVGEHALETRRDTVRLLTIDSLGLDRLDAIKIDVEGAELDVVDGMRATLARCRPAVICEMHGKNAEYVALLDELGYDVENLDGPQPPVAAHGNVQTLARPRATPSSPAAR